MWWKVHAPERGALIEYVMRPIAGVLPSASNTERTNSLHRLLIGDKRSIIKNDRAFKLLYVYQNAITLDNAKFYKNSNYALPELPLIHVAIDGDRTDEFAMFNEGAQMASEAIDDDETQEMLDIMELSFSRDDYIVSDGVESDYDDDDVDDRGINDADSEDYDDCSDSDSMESGRSDDIDHVPGGNDVTLGLRG